MTSIIPVINTTPAYTHELTPVIPPEIPYKEVVQNRGIVEAKKGNVDPLTYYCALILIAGMDELLTGCGYCQIGARRYCEMGETLRAWDRLEAEGLA